MVETNLHNRPIEEKNFTQQARVGVVGRAQFFQGCLKAFELPAGLVKTNLAGNIGGQVGGIDVDQRCIKLPARLAFRAGSGGSASA